MDIKLPIKVFAVDPATTHSGWAMLEMVSTDPLKVRVLKTGDLDGQKLLRQRKEFSAIYGNRYCVLDSLHEEYCRLLTEFQPDYVICEGAFGHRHMAVLISITLAIHQLKLAAIKTVQKRVFEMAPKLTKRIATDNGSADKDQMRDAYLTSRILIREPDTDFISEHCIDSIWHGIAGIRVHVIQDVKVESNKSIKKRRLEKQKKNHANRK